MNEPYRALVGYFRHELGHYYWDRLVAGTEWVSPCRTLFGDERQGYLGLKDLPRDLSAFELQTFFLSAELNVLRLMGATVRDISWAWPCTWHFCA